MAIHLNLENSKKDGKDVKLHWMPCTIKSDGEAKVSKYFEPIIKETKDGGEKISGQKEFLTSSGYVYIKTEEFPYFPVLQASFRGHPLLGKKLTIPKGYTGFVLQQTNERLNEEAEKDLYGCHEFNKFTYWNWDIEPSENDKIIAAFEWLEVSKVGRVLQCFFGGCESTDVQVSTRFRGPVNLTDFEKKSREDQIMNFIQVVL